MRGTLSHIEIYVKDLKQGLDFWDWFLKDLGYKVYQAWEKGQSYKLQETYIVFVQVEAKHQDQDYHRRKAGLNHLAFYGGSKEEVEKTRQKLIAKGIRLLYEEGYTKTHHALYFEDPFRMKVELVIDEKENSHEV